MRRGIVGRHLHDLRENPDRAFTVAFGKAAITDGAPLPDLYGLVAYFVGPDGTVYDCNGEAL